MVEDVVNLKQKLDFHLLTKIYRSDLLIGDSVDQNWYILINAKKTFTSTFSYRIRKKNKFENDRWSP